MTQLLHLKISLNLYSIQDLRVKLLNIIYDRYFYNLYLLQHTGHEFKPLDVIYDEHVKKITDELSLTKRRNVELISVVQDLVRNIVSVIQKLLWSDMSSQCEKDLQYM